MPIYDVSVALSSDTPTYPGDPTIEISQFLSLAAGDAANVSLIHFGAHSGTHVDAPAHFLAAGARVDSLSLATLIGEAEVVEVPSSITTIGAEFITQNCKAGVPRVLFKTRNSSFWDSKGGGFRSDYTSLDAGAARELVKLRVKLVGIDYLSIEKFGSESFETHHTLLSQGVVIVEGLDLRNVSAGPYELICLPLRLAGGTGDGAPARVVLRTIPIGADAA
ncbi:MAG TPA: cyclase family protein [Pyrinomonadaceae bacterium]|nr:cyclase family protein [Pyrinomonadaceae bacterium]